ncbi:hypothetical protein N7519_007968 [Penicillium mononematosum]|uniref:uncharacterized protein n=1 Tax=Penicillium mononematosum TaxID=268346 RepID=UPI0025481062|nr:uncharacterized protein N7519_007968 [Penicillium mononematosum]KAJ6186667.1 hypothetical protein N7519_007968 [Penicillium mononematosum]
MDEQGLGPGCPGTLTDRRLGSPTVWISDRDPKFIRGFSKSMFNALRVTLFFTTAYHAQADGQSFILAMYQQY